MAKKLYRSMSDKMVAGVCSGLAEYFDVDPTIIRLVWLVTVFCAGGGLLAYILAAIIIPQDTTNYIKY